MSLKRLHSTGRALLLTAILAGCDDAEPTAKRDDPPTRVAPVDTAEPEVTPAELRRRLGANDRAVFRDDAGRIVQAHLAGSGVTDLSPLEGLPLEVLDVRGLPVSDLSALEGMPLRELYAEETRVSNLGPVAGLPLTKLYLSDTPARDLSPLAGVELDELNLVRTQVSDLKPLETSRLGTLWLRDTDVHDLSPLTAAGLVSLDVEGTPVSDLRPLSGLASLRRLNIARTAVTDLTPLAGLRLERLIFTPSRITCGLDAVRAMPSLTRLGTQFEDEHDELEAPEFWRKLDAGEIRE